MGNTDPLDLLLPRITNLALTVRQYLPNAKDYYMGNPTCRLCMIRSQFYPGDDLIDAMRTDAWLASRGILGHIC